MVSHDSRTSESEPTTESLSGKSQDVRGGAAVAMVAALAVGASLQCADFHWLSYAALAVYLLSLLTWVFAEEVAYHICGVPPAGFSPV